MFLWLRDREGEVGPRVRGRVELCYIFPRGKCGRRENEVESCALYLLQPRTREGRLFCQLYSYSSFLTLSEIVIYIFPYSI